MIGLVFAVDNEIEALNMQTGQNTVNEKCLAKVLATIKNVAKRNNNIKYCMRIVHT